jgi:hypothetical protein
MYLPPGERTDLTEAKGNARMGSRSTVSVGVDRRRRRVAGSVSVYQFRAAYFDFSFR